MNDNAHNETGYSIIPIRDVGNRFAGLRMIFPRTERAMIESIKRHGQISPVAIGRPNGKRFEMVDGFKRLRACREIGLKDLKAQIIPGNVRALKAAMIFLNQKVKSIGDLEQGLVIRSLCREDGLNQSEVATMLGHHKSWVCRRLALVERLCEEVLNQLQLGLIPATTGRELAKLPQGNQTSVLDAVQTFNLTTGETGELVSLLKKEPEHRHKEILKNPDKFLFLKRNDRSDETSKTERLIHNLRRIGKLLQKATLTAHEMPKLNPTERDRAFNLIERMERSLKEIKTAAL